MKPSAPILLVTVRALPYGLGSGNWRGKLRPGDQGLRNRLSFEPVADRQGFILAPFNANTSTLAMCDSTSTVKRYLVDIAIKHRYFPRHPVARQSRLARRSYR